MEENRDHILKREKKEGEIIERVAENMLKAGDKTWQPTLEQAELLLARLSDAVG